MKECFWTTTACDGRMGPMDDVLIVEELKSAMQNAGVVGAPTIWLTNKV